MDANNELLNVIEAIKILEQKTLYASPSPLSLPLTVGKTSVATYNEILEMEERPKCKIRHENGEIKIVELMTFEHEQAAGEIEYQINAAIRRSDGLISCRAPTYDSSILGNPCMEPVGSWMKRREKKSTSSSNSSADGGSFDWVSSSFFHQNDLVLILEIGYSQTLDQIRARANRWLNETSAREVILIDIKISTNRRMLRGEIWRKDQNNPVQHVDFSNVTTAGTHFLHVSLENLFISERNIPADLQQRRLPNNEIPIDLFYVKKAIFA